MAKILDSYNEVGIIRPWINKIRQIGVNPRYWLYRANWRLVNRMHYVTRFPIHLDVEATNHCNLKCSICPHSMDDFKMNKGFFDLDLFKKIIKECAAERLSSLKLNMRGEPLLHKDLPEMTAIAKDHGILDVMFNTNGLLLSEQKARDLIDAGLDLLIVSIDGATSETYNRIRLGGDFKVLKANLEHVIALRKERKLSKPLIRLQYVETKENTHEVPMYLDMWRDKVDVMTVNRYSDRGCGEKQVMNMVPVGRANCMHPWRRMSLTWQGDAMMCCGDWNNLCVFGNVADAPISQLWHAKKFSEYRRLLKARRLDDIPCCKDCFVLVSYIWDKK